VEVIWEVETVGDRGVDAAVGLDVQMGWYCGVLVVLLGVVVADAAGG
jgi:hypothetical protein